MELVEIALEADLYNEPEIRKAIRYFARTGKPSAYKHVLIKCRKGIKPRLRSMGFPVPLSQGQVEGHAQLGDIIDTDLIYGMDFDDCTRHVAIAGTTGQGKTIFIINLICCLLEAGFNVISFDVKGTDFDGLVARYGVLKIHYNDIKFNILRAPKNVPIKHWKKRLTMVLAEMLGLLIASTGELYKYIDRVFKKYPDDFFPCLKEVLDEIKGNPKLYGKAGSYQDTVISRIDTITNNLSQQFFCRADFMEELMHQSWILDISDATPVEQDLLIGPILAYIYEWHRANVPRNRPSQLVTAVVIDEANQNILSIKKTHSAQTFTSSFEQYSNLSRSQGIGFVISFQAPSQVMQGFISNAHLRVSFGLGSGQEVKLMAESLGLNQRQVEKLFHLQVGECIVRRGSGYTYPVLLKSYMRDLPEPTAQDWHRNNEKIKALQSISEPYSPPKGKKFIGANINNANAEKLLIVNGEFPWCMMTELYDKAGLSGKTGGKAKEILILGNFIQEMDIEGVGSGQKKVITLTSKGEQAYHNLTKKELRKIRRTKKASYQHDWHCNRVAAYYAKQNAKVEIGCQLGLQEADVVVTQNREHTAHEITLLQSENNVEKKLDLLERVKTLVYLCVNAKQRGRLEKRIAVPEVMKHRVRFELLSKYCRANLI